MEEGDIVRIYLGDRGEQPYLQLEIVEGREGGLRTGNILYIHKAGTVCDTGLVILPRVSNEVFVK